MTALEVLREVQAAGGSLTPLEDGLRIRMPAAPPARLLDAIRERKQDLLALLHRPDACPECSGMYWWQDSVGLWRCGTCEPDPRAARMRGVTLAILGDRAFCTTPPTGDLPQPGSWARTPAGAFAELVLYRADGGEVLVRTLKGERLLWHRPEDLVGEEAWGWGA